MGSLLGNNCVSKAIKRPSFLFRIGKTEFLRPSNRGLMVLSAKAISRRTFRRFCPHFWPFGPNTSQNVSSSRTRTARKPSPSRRSLISKAHATTNSFILFPLRMSKPFLPQWKKSRKSSKDTASFPATKAFSSISDISL